MPTVHIDVESDVICPWCFLGKRRLDKAIALVPDIDVQVVFRPFFLDPTLPPEGVDRQAYMTAKFGAERLKTIHDPLIAAGKEDGVPYAFDKITRTPNTMNAHRLLRWALVAGVQRQVADDLFMAYWAEGKDIGDSAVLAAIATANRMDGAAVRAELASDKDKPAVLAEVHTAQQMGITGVPTFILARQFGIAGAQPAAELAKAIRTVAAG